MKIDWELINSNYVEKKQNLDRSRGKNQHKENKTHQNDKYNSPQIPYLRTQHKMWDSYKKINTTSKINTGWNSSVKPVRNNGDKWVLRFRNPVHLSSSLKRLLLQMNTTELKALNNKGLYGSYLAASKLPSPFMNKNSSKDTRKTSKKQKKSKATKTPFKHIESNYNFKGRKVSSKYRRSAINKSKKRSLASENSNSQKQNYIIKGKKIESKKVLSKSKVSDNYSKNHKDNSIVFANNKAENKIGKVKPTNQVSRNSLQSRKNYQNPSQQSKKKLWNQYNFNIVNKNTKGIVRTAQKSGNVFESLWSAYSENDYLNRVPKRETGIIKPMNLYSKFSKEPMRQQELP